MNFDYLKGLNQEQRQAVQHGVKKGQIAACGPFLVIAGAGSGKTKTLAHRVAHLVVNGVDPQRILLLTFSRRAASEMVGRARKIVSAAVGTGHIELPWSGTFHSVGARLLREFAHQIGLKPSFTILDRSDAADLMDIVRHELDLSKKEERFPRKDTCLAIYSLAVNSRAPLDPILARRFPYCIDWKPELQELFREYSAAKQRQNVLDYDDLLLYWAEMLKSEEIAEDIGSRFDHVLVDEYQDTNRLQAKILHRLKPDGRGLMVVGDDAQAIYSFRAATVRNILDFPNKFKPRARIIPLEENYRSTRPILDAANAVMSFAKERYTKNLRSNRKSKQKPFLTTVVDEAAQARCVAQQIIDAREAGVALKSQAVLCRASHHSAQLEIELARRNIPFVKYGGLKFLEAAHIKDLLSVLRWCENVRDRVAGFRVLQLLPGIGPATAGQVLEKVENHPNLSDVLPRIQVPKGAAEDWLPFTKLVDQLRKSKQTWPAEFQWLRSWYEPHLNRIYDDAAIRAADIAQLEQIAGGYSSRQKFLTELTLDPPDSTSGRAGAPMLDEDYTILSTIHSAKGQEWKCVRVLNVVDGCIPSDMATGTPEEIEEERRLLHVAMTRAKDELDLVVPHRFFTYNQPKWGDRHVYASVSRFIPKSIRDYFDCRTWSESDRSTSGDKPVRKAIKTVDVAANVGRMWR
jgi:DNA helicase-2/ATP-dependent DNA helicase PcrA